jgi:hypothetical protein
MSPLPPGTPVQFTDYHTPNLAYYGVAVDVAAALAEVAEGGDPDDTFAAEASMREGFTPVRVMVAVDCGRPARIGHSAAYQVTVPLGSVVTHAWNVGRVEWVHPAAVSAMFA